MKKEFISIELTNGGLFELTKDLEGNESARIVARRRKNRWHCWERITPRLTPIEDDVTPEHYAVPILAREIKTASRYNYFNSSELSRFAWKISRLGFKTTAQKISWLLKEPLNGYPINLDTEFEEIILINGSKNKPFLISGRIEYDNHWKFDLKRGLSKTSQDKLLDDIALSSLHDFRLRRLLKRSRFEYFENHASERRSLHQNGSRPLRQWKTRSGIPHHFQINRASKKEVFDYCLILKVFANNAITGAGIKGSLNNALTRAFDTLADQFRGKYKLEGVEAYFELATDLMHFVEELKSFRFSSLRDAQVYLRVTEGYNSTWPNKGQKTYA